MKIIKTIQRKLSPTIVFAVAAMVSGVFIVGAAGVSKAFAAPVDYAGNIVTTEPQGDDEVNTGGGGGVKTSILPASMDAIGLVKMGIWIMTAGVGVTAVGGIVWGAILYSSAGSSDRAKKGIEVIRNVIIGLLLYVFMFSIINYLIPGGLS